MGRLRRMWNTLWYGNPEGLKPMGVYHALILMECMQWVSHMDTVDAMTTVEKDRMVDRFFRLQTSVATRDDFDQVKALYVKRRLRGEVDQAWLDREFSSLAKLWKTSRHYDGRD